MANIIGLGLDATDIERIAATIERYGERFVHRIFTDGEVAYCTRRRLPAIHFAGRFAAKEAAMKALGTGHSQGVVWRDIEVVRRTGGAQRPGEPDAPFPDADIIVSDDPAVALAIQTADCAPLLVADRRTGAVAAAHAGWKGLAASVPRVTVDALSRHVGSQPADLVAAVGPSVGACCYEVGVDVLDAFRRGGFGPAARQRWFFTAPQPSAKNPSMPRLPPTRRPDHWFFDGWAAARQQLEIGRASCRERV